MKTRLVALDFVLGHPQHRYLETEPENVAFFANQNNTVLDALPVKQYRAKKSADVTPRDVDWGCAMLQGFITHLEAVRGLLRYVPQFDLFMLRQRSFLQGSRNRSFPGLCWVESTCLRVSNYSDTQLRKRWEAGERVAATDVVLLNGAKWKVRHESVELQYGKWIEGAIKTPLYVVGQRLAHLARGPFYIASRLPDNCRGTRAGDST